MPATAGRVRMPANNRQSTSSALQTNAIWQSVVGYDPYKNAAGGAAGAAAPPTSGRMVRPAASASCALVQGVGHGQARQTRCAVFGAYRRPVPWPLMSSGSRALT